MALAKTLTFEEGTAGNTLVTTTDIVQVIGTARYTATHKHGSLAMSSLNGGYISVTTASNAVGFSCYAQVGSMVAGSARICTFTDSLNTFIGMARIHLSGVFDICDNATTRVAVSTSTWTAGAWYRIDVTISGTGLTRSMTMKIFDNVESTVALETIGPVNVTSGTSNTADRIRTGAQGVTNGEIFVDTVRVYDTAEFAAPYQQTLTINSMSVADSIQVPALTMKSTLVPNNLIVADSIQAPVLTQKQLLTISNQTVADSIQAPALTQAHLLSIANMASSDAIQTVTIAQKQLLVIDNMTVPVAIPTAVVNPALVINNLLVAVSIPAVGITQQHALVVPPMVTAPAMDGPALGTTGSFGLTISDLTVSPSISTLHMSPIPSRDLDADGYVEPNRWRADLDMKLPRSILAGSSEYVWVKILERRGQDLTGTNVSLRAVRMGGTPGSWVDPDSVLFPTQSSVRCALLFTASDPGTYLVQARLNDNPEVVVLNCGYFSVVEV